MYGAKTYVLPYIRNYEEAKRYFNKTPASRGRAWSDHKRPLDNTRKYHYRIEKGVKGGVEYFDVCHHRTALARYYAPDAEGFERRLYRGWDSMSSRAFMWDVLHIAWSPRHPAFQMCDMAGVKRWVPIAWWIGVYDTYMGTVDLWVKDGCFALHRSAHTPWARYVQSPEEKEQQARYREMALPWVQLMQLQVGTWVKEAMEEYAIRKIRVHRIGGTRYTQLGTSVWIAQLFRGTDDPALADAVRDVLCTYVKNAVWRTMEYGDKGEAPDFSNWEKAATQQLVQYAPHAGRRSVSVPIPSFPPTDKPWSTTWKQLYP